MLNDSAICFSTSCLDSMRAESSNKCWGCLVQQARPQNQPDEFPFQGCHPATHASTPPCRTDTKVAQRTIKRQRALSKAAFWFRGLVDCIQTDDVPLGIPAGGTTSCCCVLEVSTPETRQDRLAKVQPHCVNRVWAANLGQATPSSACTWSLSLDPHASRFGGVHIGELTGLVHRTRVLILP